MQCSECGGPLPIVRRPANLRQGLWGGWTCPHCEGEFDRWNRRIAPVRPSFASLPAGLTVSSEKLSRLRPELFGLSGRIHRLKVKVGLEWDQLAYLDRHLANGDSQAAVVISIEPFRVAAYTSELDGVAILDFPYFFAVDYQLEIGSRLLTVNAYTLLYLPDDDIEIGPEASGRWNGFNPIIADFVADDVDRVEELKSQIPEDEWDRAWDMAKDAFRRDPGLARDGRPIYSGVSATVTLGE